MNYIWDMERSLPNLPEDVFTVLVSRNSCPLASLAEEEAALCWDLDQELMRTQAIAGRASVSTMLDNIVFIYQQM